MLGAKNNKPTMITDIYEQIEKLKSNDSISRQKKGFLFEQLVREIQPWDFKPPIVTTGISEQLDGVFNWDGKTFIIECKAKEKEIKRGDHDWEDFELKIRKRKGSVIGLYCCLYAINDSIYEAATDLNKEGVTTLIMADKFWFNLNIEKLEFGIILNYLITYARASFKPSQDDIKKIKDWHFNNDDIQRRINSVLIYESSTFLRRFKKENHSKLYVRREIDKNIYDYARQLKPSALKQKFKTKDIKGTEHTYEQKKEPPIQIFMLRDFSGAGKTFFSIEYAEHREFFLSYTKAANQKDIDNIPDILEKISPHFGVQELILLDKPILFFIDSLDEAIYSQNKHIEVRSAIEFVNGTLNSVGRKFDLSAFPFGLVFTIREDYWRAWESDFEGRRTINSKKVISSFNDKEFDTALSNYSNVYSFNIVNKIDKISKNVLSIPINLSIFSEANEYKGDIRISEIWEEHVLHSYFNRKKENVTKRNIPGITAGIFIKICTDIAFFVVKNKLNQIHKKDILSIVQSNYIVLEPLFEELILLLESESLLVFSSENRHLFRFKHNKFIEFLSSYYILYQLDRLQDFEILDIFSDSIFESGVASMFKIHDFIIFISKKEFPSLAEEVDNHYANSEKFMTRSLKRLRSDIATGEASGKRALNLILKKCSSKNPEITWDSFFVVVAKKNNPESHHLLTTFKNAWDSNFKSQNLWKLLPKMTINNLLVTSEVITRVISSNDVKVWEVFLGLILENNLREEFKEIWNEVDKDKILNQKMVDKDWDYNKNLIDIILNDKEFVKGIEFCT